MPNILKGRHTSDFSNKGHCKNTLSNGSVKSEREADRKYSVVMVGSGGVGKSSITLRFVYDEFEEFYDPTRADSYRKTIKDPNGKVTEIDILDTAGQEEYAAIRDNYYRSGEGFILVYSITDRGSFSAISDFRSQIIRSLNDPSPPLLLIGNKNDLDAFRAVSSEEGISLAESWGKFCKFLEVSAKKDQGIDSIFTEISRLIENKKKSLETTKSDPKSIKKKKKFKCQLQ